MQLGDTAPRSASLEVSPRSGCGAPRLVDDDGLQPTLDLRLNLDHRAWLAGHPRGHVVARAGVPRLELAEDVGCSHEVLPAREHFAAQEGAVLRRGIDGVDRGLVVRVGGGLGTVEPVELLLAGIRNAGHALIEIGDRAAQGARGDAGAGCAVASNALEPGPRAVDRTRGQHAELIERLLVDREHGRVGEAAIGEHRAQVGQHLVDGSGRHPVEHDADRD